MRRWGIVVTAFYALAVVGLYLPSAYWLAGNGDAFARAAEEYRRWEPWPFLATFVGGEALLLFLTVDASRRRLTARASLLLSVGLAALLLAMLTWASAAAVSAVAWGDHMMDRRPWQTGAQMLALWGGLWVVWGIAFYRSYRGRGLSVDRVVAWLLRGSVVELLVAVPCHVWVRRRDQCSAPAMTGFGISTGMAIMLLSFGPGVLFLVKKRLDGYRR